jgi:hypothetical protein
MAPGRPVSVYVYYRIAAGDRLGRVAARAIVATLQDRVAAATGVRGTLLVRRDDPSTWMEIYAPVTAPAAFARALAQAVRASGARGIAERGVRHVERFVALPAR